MLNNCKHQMELKNFSIPGNRKKCINRYICKKCYTEAFTNADGYIISIKVTFVIKNNGMTDYKRRS